MILVDGDDPILVSDAVRSILDALIGDRDPALVVSDFRSDEVDVAVVADGCATPPFLSDLRIVVLRDVGRYSTGDLAPVLAYLDDPLETTVLVLAAGEGAIAPGLVTAVKTKGRVVGTRVGRAGDWVRQRVRAGPVRLDGGAEELVVAHLGEDVGRLGVLLDVLAAAYGDGARIDADQVRPYLGQAGSVAPWTLTDAIDAGDREGALTQLHRLLGAGERHPLVVLAILHRHVQSLLRVDGPAIRSEAQAAAALGIAPGRSTFPAKKALRAAGQWGSGGVSNAIGLLAAAELDLKGASAWPPETVLEVLVARLCRLARSRLPGGAAGARSGGGRPSRPVAARPRD